MTTAAARGARRRRRSTRPLWAGAAIGAGMLAFAGILAPVPAAHATHETDAVTYAVAFDRLVPGVTATEDVRVEIPRTGTLLGAGWTNRVGLLADADLSIALCTTTGVCTAAADAIDTVLEAGPLDVRVSITIPVDALPAEGSAHGALTIAADHDGAATGALPATGGGIAPWIAAAGASAIVAGLLLALRRERREETP